MVWDWRRKRRDGISYEGHTVTVMCFANNTEWYQFKCTAPLGQCEDCAFRFRAWKSAPNGGSVYCLCVVGVIFIYRCRDNFIEWTLSIACVSVDTNNHLNTAESGMNKEKEKEEEENNNNNSFNELINGRMWMCGGEVISVSHKWAISANPNIWWHKRATHFTELC